jgi:hypothetical protein
MTRPATITLRVDDWDLALRAEHDAIVSARGGWPLTADELRTWLAAVEARQRAIDGEGTPTADGSPALVGSAVPIPGTAVVLRSWTVAGAIRRDQVEAWRRRGEIPEEAADLLLVYILAHGADASALALLGVRGQAVATAREWGAASLTCPWPAVAAAVHRLIAADPYPPPEGEPPGEAQPPTGRPSSAASATRSGEPPPNGSTASPSAPPPGSSAPSATTSPSATNTPAPPVASAAPRTPTAPR